MSRTLSLSTSAFSPEVFAPVKLSGKEYLNELFALLVKLTDVLGLIVDKKEEILAEDIEKLAGDDENFRGLVINPHSQNFMMDRNGGF